MLPLGRVSPYRLDTPEIREKEQLLARLAGKLESALHPESAFGLRKALAGIHSYYSNMIEGDSTEPITAELAISGAITFAPGSNAEKYVIQAKAGILASAAMQKSLAAGADPLTVDFIKFLHFEFTSRLPPEWLVMTDPDGKEILTVPGAFRTGFVKVGTHIAPAPHEIVGLVNALAEFPKIIGRTLSSIMLQHHRLAWIHPFADGNGRTTRLFTEALLLNSVANGNGLWCLSRGLAKNAEKYKAYLRAADISSGGSDGRGELSQKQSEVFAGFMLDVAIDQADFMSERLEIDSLKQRIELLCQERYTVLKRDKRASMILSAAMFEGPLERGRVGGLVGLSARRGQEIARELIDDGLLTSRSDKGRLMPAFPMYAMGYLVPSLFPLDNPRAAMRDYLEKIRLRSSTLGNARRSPGGM